MSGTTKDGPTTGGPSGCATERRRKGWAMAATSERTVTVWQGQVQARVKAAGSGPALVFLHSGYGLVWDEFLDLLARDFTVYAPEHPGTSDGLPDAVKPLDDVWDLTLFYEELFEQLGLKSAAV